MITMSQLACPPPLVRDSTLDRDKVKQSSPRKTWRNYFFVLFTITSFCLIFSPQTAEAGIFGKLVKRVYDALPSAESMGLCPSGYNCGTDEIPKTLGVNIETRDFIELVGDAAAIYYLGPGGIAGSSSVQHIYDSLGGLGRKGWSKIYEITETCNWKGDSETVNKVARAIADNQLRFANLLKQGGLRHACNNVPYWWYPQ